MFRWLFPVKCPFCGKILREGYACSTCIASLPRPDAQRIRSLTAVCGCARLYVPFSYKGTARAALHAFKFRDKPEYAAVFAAEIARLLECKYDMIAFAPMRYYHQNQRGYNQAELIARALSKQLDVPCVPLLQKDRRNRAQHGLSADERLENVQAVYSIRGVVPGQAILLVDDVITTGNTMSAMASCIWDAGAARVDGAAYAAAEPKKNNPQENRKSSAE